MRAAKVEAQYATLLEQAVDRALNDFPKVLILDEETANLDPESEARIVEVIAGLDITRIVVAHRPALVDRAGLVFRVDNRQVVRER